MSNYFTAYEAKRKLYNKVQPGTVWGFKPYPLVTFTVKHIDLVNKRVWGVSSILADEISIISFEYLVECYNLLKQTQEVK